MFLTVDFCHLVMEKRQREWDKASYFSQKNGWKWPYFEESN
jgi:hypothetical protein